MNELTWAALVPECSVADFNRSLSFYTDLLGFTVRHNRTDPAFAYLDLQGAQIMIEQLSDDSWKTGEMAAPHGRGINFQIEVSDLSPILKRL